MINYQFRTFNYKIQDVSFLEIGSFVGNITTCETQKFINEYRNHHEDQVPKWEIISADILKGKSSIVEIELTQLS